MTFTISQPIQPPIYVYYQLDNFYQNHRRYVKSRSYDQLKGEYVNTDKAFQCDPIIRNKDIANPLMNYKKTKVLNPEDVAMPCGLVAKSFFNDTYKLVK
jgi:hypothetical protein